MREKIVLIDGNSIVNRAFYGLPDLTTTDGRHTNGILGFFNILLKLLEEEKPLYLAVAFDVKHPTFRHEKYAEYKGTRKGMPEELREQIPVLKELLDACGILRLERPGYEADDILGTLAKQSAAKGYEVSLVSGDRDLLQIADDVIKVRIPKTKRTGTEIEDYHTQDVIEKYGLTPAQIIDLKGLMGDASDNIPGVPGIGEKTAVKLLSRFETVENTIAHIDEVMPNKARESLRENSHLALLSKELATIKTDCELEFTYEDARLGNIFTKEAFQILKQLEMKSLLAKFSLSEEEMTEQVSVSDEYEMVEEPAKADKLFQTLIKEELVAISAPVHQENMQLDLFSTGKTGLMLAAKEKTYYLVSGDTFTEELLWKKLNMLAENGVTIALFGAKTVAAHFSAEARKNIFDAEIAAYLLNPLKDSYLPVDVARDYLNISIPSEEDILHKQPLSEAISEGREEAYRLLARNTRVTYLAKEALLLKLSEEGMRQLYEEVELPLVFVLYEMEAAGIRINKEELFRYGARLQESITALEKEIHEMAGEVFNINSPKQLGVILFEKLKLPGGKKTKTGYSTSAEVLEKLKQEDPIIEKILEYRTLSKLKSTYADGLDAFIKEDGRIHTRFQQTVTATGRLSSAEPNLQNIPVRIELGRQIRKMFTPKEGCVFVDADYSQIELRILAHMSGDESLIQAYKEEQDIHRMTASKVFHIPFDEVTPAQRSNAKAVNFGIVYGISSFGLGQDLNITRKEAENYINQYFATYPGIKNYLDGLVAEAKETGSVSTLYGRKRPVPEIASSNFMQRSFGERIAMNSPIQGTAADIMKIAMLRVDKALKEKGLTARILLQIHDELLMEAPVEEAAQVAELLQTEMMAAADLRVPLSVEVKTGENWYETK
ncbi:MAG: DNA polymerase I [Lachnospiraceae bacterium]|nr:DNA polymerase I [Lachnospiraceae bacterium]